MVKGGIFKREMYLHTMKILSISGLLLLILYSPLIAQTWLTPFEKSNGTKTATYQEVLDFYNRLAINFPKQMKQAKPLNTPTHLPPIYILGAAKDSPAITLLINNAIHAGEPDGVDACMLLVRDIAVGNYKLPPFIRLIIVPVFNSAGVLQRGSFSRANQNGPDEYGFRANGQYLDLNRDFMKADAPETRELQNWLCQERVDIFIDNHVSDGADYQHLITLLVSQHNKMQKPIDELVSNDMVPQLYQLMKEKKYDLCPYVNHFSETPEQGWQAFYDPPRFASGFANLLNCIPMVVETHMLKPFKERVEATFSFLKCTITYASMHQKQIANAHLHADQLMQQQTKFYLNYACDTTAYDWITFKGYESGHKPSEISGQDRLYYDRSRPFTKQVKFYNQFKPIDSVIAPSAYIVPAAFVNKEVERFQLLLNQNYFNEQVLRDTSILVEVYEISSFSTVKNPYEGHYLHYDTKVKKMLKPMKIHAGDYIFRLNNAPLQSGSLLKRYLIETFEPMAPDSWFNWNGCDAVLQQKEGYSDYVFEDMAATYLKAHPELQSELAALKAHDEAFAKNGAAQLNWVYKHSPWYETGVNIYPVYRWNY